MTNKMTVKDLAKGFYCEFCESGAEVYDPEYDVSQMMSEINEMLFKVLDFNTANELEGKILMMSAKDVEQYYIWGFEKALELCRLVYGQKFSAAEIEASINKASK